jgi:hypothetical protein
MMAAERIADPALIWPQHHADSFFTGFAVVSARWT